MNKHSLLNCDPCEECGNKFKKTVALQRELVEALRKNVERMKLINGPDEKCCGISAENCPNHGLIKFSEDLINRALREIR